MPVFFKTRKNKRHTNQDSYLCMEYRVNHEAMMQVFVIADGMGGLDCGELASSMAVERWILHLQKFTMSKEFLGRSLNEQIKRLENFSYAVIETVNKEIYQEFSDRGLTGGTTLTAGILYWDTLLLTNCGDSPAYFYRKSDDSFRKITKDQNAAEQLVREGKIQRSSDEYEKQKNLLTDYLGKYRRSEPVVSTHRFQEGDRLLLGSDGAFGTLEESQIRTLLEKKRKTPEQVPDSIFEAANRAGEEDNQTLIYYYKEEKLENRELKKKEKRSLFGRRQAVKTCTR